MISDPSCTYFDGSDITPVIDSVVYTEAAQCLPIGGKDVEGYLLQLLREDTSLATQLGRPLQREDCRKFKESSACEILSGAARLGRGNLDQRVAVDLGGVTGSIGRPRTQCMELLFDPSLVGKHCVGLAQAIDISMCKVDLDKRIPLYENVILVGGLSSVKGTCGLACACSTANAPFCLTHRFARTARGGVDAFLGGIRDGQ